MPRYLLLTAPVLVGCLAAQAPEAKPVDWKDLTKSGIPIKFYGYLRLDAYYDTARADSVVLPFRALAENGKANDNEFFLDPRLTRIGVDVLPGEIAGAKVAGKIEMDFSNVPTGNVESRSGPRMRLAYIDIDEGDYGFRFGQDWDVISPLFPAVNHETLMWNAGNLGDRRAQIQGRYGAKDSSLSWKASLGLTGAINGEDIDGGGAKDGWDSGLPHAQLRGAWKGDLLVEKKPATIGAWGALGRSEIDTTINGQTRFDTWVVGGDFEVPLCSCMTFRGEAWTGADLGDFRGGIGQTVNRATGKEISSTGGWGEVVYAATAKTRFHLGGSVDDPDNGDLRNTAGEDRRRNLAGYAGTVVDWDNGVRTGFDVLYWETDYVAAGIGNMVRFDLYFQLNF